MKNTFGQSVSVTVFGESHGRGVGAVIDGLAPGVEVSEEQIAFQLARRRPSSALDTARQEQDPFEILSGVFRGRSTGAPLCIFIPNGDAHSGDYTYGPARPSHADYAAYCKYHGYEDYRGGGHFSGRVTAALTAVGGVLLPALERLGVVIATHILQCAGVRDREFEDLKKEAGELPKKAFPVLEESRGEEMQRRILAAREAQDSVGGVIQTAIGGLPAGLGEPWFDSLEGLLSHAVFSIGGVKGVEFGAGFAGTELPGSRFNDPLRMDNGRVVTESNHNGGINGGISNGMPVLFQCAVKPTPSIARPQRTVDFLRGEETELTIRGRHDPAIVRRICPVLDSVTAMVISDALAQRYGTDVFLRGLER